MAEDENQSALNEQWDRMVRAVFHRSRIMPNREMTIGLRDYMEQPWSAQGAQRNHSLKDLQTRN